MDSDPETSAVFTALRRGMREHLSDRGGGRLKVLFTIWDEKIRCIPLTYSFDTSSWCALQLVYARSGEPLFSIGVRLYTVYTVLNTSASITTTLVRLVRVVHHIFSSMPRGFSILQLMPRFRCCCDTTGSFGIISSRHCPKDYSSRLDNCAICECIPKACVAHAFVETATVS